MIYNWDLSSGMDYSAVQVSLGAKPQGIDPGLNLTIVDSKSKTITRVDAGSYLVSIETIEKADFRVLPLLLTNVHAIYKPFVERRLRGGKSC